MLPVVVPLGWRPRERAGWCCLLIVLGCAGACASVTQARQSGMRALPDGAALVPAAPERSSFSVALTEAEGTAAASARKPLGSLTLTVRSDNVVTYAVQIDNVEGETFTQALLVRVAPDSSADVVATLFSEVMMRGRRIRVRGSASLARSLPPEALLAHIRERPSEYEVIVRGERHPFGSLVGNLGVKR